MGSEFKDDLYPSHLNKFDLRKEKPKLKITNPHIDLNSWSVSLKDWLGIRIATPNAFVHQFLIGDLENYIKIRATQAKIQPRFPRERAAPNTNWRTLTSHSSRHSETSLRNSSQSTTSLTGPCANPVNN